MSKDSSAVAIYNTHTEAEAAIRRPGKGRRQHETIVHIWARTIMRKRMWWDTTMLGIA